MSERVCRYITVPPRSSFDLSCADELSKSETATIYRLIIYYAP